MNDSQINCGGNADILKPRFKHDSVFSPPVPTVDQVFPLGNVREQLVECLVVLDEALNTGDSACYSVCFVLWQRQGSTEASAVMRHHTNAFVPVDFFPLLMMIEMMIEMISGRS